ncbi:MAG: transposase [Candidatus Competibacteraceae bacterium]|nr:transposase [Candidatus Competibacteraceae bacterium]MBK8754608.1 transposase [Candidatus Competibacteraceae bacterium]
MRRIDELHLNYPFAGARMLQDVLGLEGVPVGRRHVSTLMRKRGIDARYRRPNTRRKQPGNPVFPYLLRGLDISRANPVWAKATLAQSVRAVQVNPGTGIILV